MRLQLQRVITLDLIELAHGVREPDRRGHSWSGLSQPIAWRRRLGGGREAELRVHAQGGREAGARDSARQRERGGQGHHRPCSSGVAMLVPGRLLLQVLQRDARFVRRHRERRPRRCGRALPGRPDDSHHLSRTGMELRRFWILGICVEPGRPVPDLHQLRCLVLPVASAFGSG